MVDLDGTGKPQRWAKVRLDAARFLALLLHVLTGLVTFGAGLAMDGRLWLALMITWCAALAALLWRWSQESALQTIAIPLAYAGGLVVVLVWADSAGLTGP